MIEIATHERVVEERHAIKVEEIAVGTDRFIFRYCEEITRTGAQPKTVRKEGIATARQMRDLRAGLDTKYLHYRVFDDERLDDVRRMGVMGIAYDSYKAWDDNKASIFEHVANGGSLDNIVRFDLSDHSFWRADGTLLPTGIAFDYIQAGIHNGAYDLEKLVEILRKRDDVTIMAGTERSDIKYGAKRRRVGDKPFTAEPGEEIDDIPYYNREGGVTRTVTFFWRPTQDVAERIQKDYMNRHQIVFEEDLLGLRAGGAARFDSFFERGRDYTLDDDEED